MKKNLFLGMGLGLLASCQGISEKKMTAMPSQAMIVPVQTVAHIDQATIVEEYGQDEARTIWIEVVPDLMKYDTDTFSVSAGEKIILQLDNMDGMQHNLLIAKPGTLEKVGAAADAMLRDPKAAEKHYVPEIPEVLFSTEMVDPGEVYTLKFTAPSEPGYYPFVCTFPGHWRMMNGIMKVEK